MRKGTVFYLNITHSLWKGKSQIRISVIRKWNHWSEYRIDLQIVFCRNSPQISPISGGDKSANPEQRAWHCRWQPAIIIYNVRNINVSEQYSLKAMLMTTLSLGFYSPGHTGNGVAFHVWEGNKTMRPLHNTKGHLFCFASRWLCCVVMEGRKWPIRWM